MKTTLGEVAEPRSERANPGSAPNAKFIGLEQVEAHSMKLLGTVRAGTMKSMANVFQAHDVLYGRLRSYLNKVYQPDFSGLCSGEFIVFAESSAISGKFLKYRLNAPDFVAFASRINTGDRPRVDFDQISTFELLLPPKEEQDRIADALDVVLSELHEATTALHRIQSTLPLYRAAVLNSAINGKLLEGAISNMTPLGEVIQSLDQGWSPKCDRVASEKEDEWAVIKTTAVQPLRFVASENKRLPKSLKPRPHLELSSGDLLVTRAGPRSRVGVAALVTACRPHLMLCDKVYRLRINQEKASPRFIEFALNAPEVVDKLNTLKTGMSDSGVNLTQKRFQELQLPLPDVRYQEKLVELVDDHISIFDYLESLITMKTQLATALKSSVLRCAFAGKLVPQQDFEEPATESLKRIAAERERHKAEARASKSSTRKKMKRYQAVTVA